MPRMNKINLIEQHPADIRASLEKAGETISSVAREIGMDRRDVSLIVNNANRVYAALAEKLQSAA
jgi:lambda repressor-like predicted transcriptional regulator